MSSLLSPSSLEHTPTEKDVFPPWGKLILSGFVQTTILLIYLVLPMLIYRYVGAPESSLTSSCQFSMIALAVGTCLQALRTRHLGSGYFNPPTFSTIYFQASMIAVSMGGISLMVGMTVFAGCAEMVVSKLMGILRRIFPPLVIGFSVMLVGLQLGLKGLSSIIDMGAHESIDAVHKHVWVGGSILLLMIGMTVWGKKYVRLLSIPLGIFLGLILAFIFGIAPETSVQQITNNEWFSFPHYEWPGISFDRKLIPIFLVSAILAALRTLGTVTTCQKGNDPSWKRPDIQSLQGGIAADGASCALAGLAGTMGVSTSPSSVSFSQFNQLTSRVLSLSVAAWLLIISCLPKVVALVLAIPFSVAGSAMVVTGCMLIVSGLEIFHTKPLNSRQVFVFGVSLLFGLLCEMKPEYFTALPEWASMWMSSALAGGTMVAVILNQLLKIGSKQVVKVRFAGQIEEEDFIKLMKKSASEWNLPKSELERVVQTVASLSESILQRELVSEGDMAITMMYTESLLEVNVRYKGKLIELPNQFSKSDEKMEETALVQGLSKVFHGFYPDHIQLSEEGDQCLIKIGFDLQ